ncbi:MAG: hypothetical protein J6A24_00185 [Clostridia bacterium]|nr:hypothetical protein [Clostridia bacterium]
MTQEKMRKVIAACVSAATVLFVLLFTYLIYQWVTLAVLNEREQKLQDEITRLEQTLEDDTKVAEHYESELMKQWLAIQQGWRVEEEEDD